MHPILTTPRLVLTPMVPGDAPDMVALNSDPEVTRYTGDGPFASLEEALALVTGYDQYTRFGTGRLICRTIGDGRFLGFCGLRTDPATLEVDLGFRLMRKWWGQGYAREASEACLRYGFEVLGLDVITAKAMAANQASVGLLARLGFAQHSVVVEDGASWQTFTLHESGWHSSN